MIHHITVKGEGSLAVRTNPNIVQIFRVHIFCLVVNNSQFDLSIGRSSYGANHYKRRHFLLQLHTPTPDRNPKIKASHQQLFPLYTVIE
jgi:hypothetical protein